MTYKVELPEKLAGVHNVFHVSHLRKCLHRSAEVVEPSILEDMEVEDEVTLRRAPIRIMEMKTKKLRSKEVKLVKAQWSETEEDATWETKEKMRVLYPFLFEDTFSISFPRLVYLPFAIHAYLVYLVL